MGRYTTGVAVVTTRQLDGKLEGLTVNSFASVSLDPPLVLWSLKADSASRPGFTASGHFAVNVLATWHHDLCRHFARPAADKFAGLVHTEGLGGCPLLPDAIAHLECREEQQIIAGDHVIFIGRVLRFEQRDGEPLVFSAGAFCRPGALLG